MIPSKVFIQFLTDEKLLDKFKVYTNRYKGPNRFSFRALMRKMDKGNIFPRSIVAMSFIWGDTEEESKFWFEVKRKWVSVCIERIEPYLSLKRKR